jgi:FkbM family methyltransferase
MMGMEYKLHSQLPQSLNSVKSTPIGMKLLKSFVRILPRGRMPLMDKLYKFFPGGLYKAKWRGLNMIFNFRDRDSWLLYFNDITERYQTPYFEETVLKGATFLDIGANNGYYSLYAATLNKTSKIYAFEANPKLVDLLTEVVKMNGLENTISIISGAVSNKTEDILFDFSNTAHQGTGHVVNSTQNYSGLTAVSALRIDEWAAQNNIHHIDVVKIDVEGAEMDVLLGMEQYISRQAIDVLFIEVHDAELPSFGTSSQTLFSFLAAKQYQCFALPSEFSILPGNRYNPRLSEIPLAPLEDLANRNDKWWHCIALSPNALVKYKIWLPQTKYSTINEKQTNY